MLAAVLAAGIAELPTARADAPNPENQQVAVFSKDGSWVSLPTGMPEVVKHGQPSARPKEFTAWMLDRDAMSKTLAAAPAESLVTRRVALPSRVQIPLPDGTLETFAISEVSVMEPELAAKIPDAKTYAGQSETDPAKTLRCELTELGFTGQIFAPEGVYLIEPYNQFDQQFYAVFRKDVLDAPDFRCGVDGFTPDNNPMNAVGAPNLQLRGSATARTSDTRKTYRLAVATTPSFTATNGGDSATLSRIVVLANRLNQIYTQEFNIAFTLVGNNNLIIFNSTTNVPPTAYNEANASSMLTVNQSNVNARIGAANYDAGHVCGAVAAGQTNGIAGAIGNICTTTKAQGVSLGDNTTTDFFVVDYVAHELGHQFGGRHLFNSCGGSQGDSSTIAVEPGSGITIMCYAGICGATDNIAAHSIPHFNTLNIDQIVTYTTTGSGTCAAGSATGNTGPTASAGADFTIPPSTPYTLTGSGTDPNGDALTFSWEQVNGGPVRSLATTSGTALNSGPLVIPLVPSSSPSRSVPPLANILNNTLNNQQLLAPAARTMNYRCTVRDNNGGVDSDAMVLTIAGTTPFSVTSPNTAVTWAAGPQTVTWAVAGTSAAPYNAANVRILLSTDGGSTFPTVLASSTPNTGSASVTIPNTPSTTARIRVEAIGNIFFDIGNANFTITAPASTPNFALGTRSISDAVANGNSNGVIDPGENNIAVTVQISNSGAASSSTTGTLSSLTSTATITSASATQNYPNIGTGGSASNASPYILQVAAGHPCGNPINLRLTVNAAGLSPAQTFDFSLPTGTPGGAGSPVTFTYSGAAVSIPDNNTTGANATINVSGLTGTITKIAIRFTGATCSTANNATTVGLSHTYVGDLVGTLSSPSGTSVTIFNRPGGTGNSGNNFCQTLLDDAGTNLFQSITAAGNPYSGTFRPNSPLSAFNGLNPNGTWTLNVADLARTDTGAIRSFQIIITTTSGPTCTAARIAAAGACNPADLTSPGATYDPVSGTLDVGPDGQLSVEDFVAFLNAFSDGTGCPAAVLGTGPCNPADITGPGATYEAGALDTPPDGELSVEDFLSFLAAFSDAAGCGL